MEDLRALTTADFSARHGVSAGAVSEARQKYLGERRLRPAGWWRESLVREDLLSDAPAAQLAEKYGISPALVRGLRGNYSAFLLDTPDCVSYI